VQNKTVLLAAVLIVASFSTSNAQSIAIFAGPDCGECNLQTTPNVPQSFYVCVVAGQEPPLEIFGGTFRLSGIPPEWTPSITAFPYVTLGLNVDPFGNGMTFAFSPLQDLSCIPILTVTMTSTSTDEHAIRVLEHLGYSYGCPTLGLARQMGHDVCVGGGAMFVNSQQTCSVTVQQSTWAILKMLFD